MKLGLLLMGLIALSGCTTYSVTVVHSAGHATDTLSEDQTDSPVVSPNLSVPASLVGK